MFRDRRRTAMGLFRQLSPAVPPPRLQPSQFSLRSLGNNSGSLPRLVAANVAKGNIPMPSAAIRSTSHGEVVLVLMRVQNAQVAGQLLEALMTRDGGYAGQGFVLGAQRGDGGGTHGSGGNVVSVE